MKFPVLRPVQLPMNVRSCPVFWIRVTLLGYCLWSVQQENMSNGSNIVILALDTPLSGKYSCEVSADAPSFHTTIVSAEMEVVGE